MRTLCASLVIALFAFTAAVADSTTPAPPPTQSAAATTAAEKELAAAREALAEFDMEAIKAEVELALTSVDTTVLAELESALAATGVASAAIAAEIEAALAGLDSATLAAALDGIDVDALAAEIEAERAVSSAQAYAAAEQGYAANISANDAYAAAEAGQAIAATQCPFAAISQGDDALHKALEELQASGDLTEAGAARLKKLFGARATRAQSAAGYDTIYREPLRELRGGFSYPAEHRTELAERVAKLEAQLAELTARLSELAPAE